MSKIAHEAHQENLLLGQCAGRAGFKKPTGHMKITSPQSHEENLLLPCRMGKVPVRLREVVYTLSPFETTVLNGLWKDLPQKAHRKISEVSCIDWLWLLGQGSGV